MATANAQGVVNSETARTQARLNRANTYTPWGSVEYGEGEGDRWTSYVNLSPEQQQIYNQGTALESGANNLALDMLPQARQRLMAPMATDDADARDRATAGIMSRMEPQFAQDRAALEARLTSQGFRPGSEAYIRAAQEHGQNVNDARMQAITAGLGESRAGAAFSNAQRAQGINEMALLFGLGPGMQVPQAEQVSQVGVAAPDLMGAVYQNYNARAQNYRNNVTASADVLGRIFGMAGGYMGGMGSGGASYTAGIKGGMGRLVGGV